MTRGSTRSGPNWRTGFGELPDEAEALLGAAQVRMLAQDAGVRRIDAGPAAIALTPVNASDKAPAGL